jgi:transcriptional antiterminator NusG
LFSDDPLFSKDAAKHEPNGKVSVTDQPSNSSDQPHDPAERPSDQPGFEQVGMAAGSSDEVGQAANPAGEVVAEAPAEPPTDEPSPEPAEEVAAETQAEPPEPPTDEPPPDEPSPEPVAADTETDPDQPAEPAEEVAAETQAEPAEEEPKSENMDWYILKVQSNREESIREGLLRRVAIAGLGQCFGQIIVPTEKVTEFKGGKKRVSKRKLYPGYLVIEMEINDDTWFLVRETPGIGDFTGAAGHPTPMLPHEVSRILAKQEEKSEKAPKLKIAFIPGDQVKINEGTFENFEGEVGSIDQASGQVTVMINIFGRSTPVTLEYWQIESV